MDFWEISLALFNSTLNIELFIHIVPFTKFRATIVSIFLPIKFIFPYRKKFCKITQKITWSTLQKRELSMVIYNDSILNFRVCAQLNLPDLISTKTQSAFTTIFFHFTIFFSPNECPLTSTRAFIRGKIKNGKHK